MEKFSLKREPVGNDNYIRRFNSGILPPSKNCPLSVPGEYTLQRKPVNHSRGARKSPELKYKKLAKEAHEGFISDQTLIESYKERLKERAIIFFYPKDGPASVFYGKVKGSDQYNSMITDRINAASSALVKNYNFFYFLTFTYAYNIFGTDIVKAWKLFNKHLSKTLKALRKQYQMGYVCVLESTKKGYPHAHIILATDKAVEDWHEQLPDGKKIEHGEMYEFIKLKVSSPVFAVQKAGGKGLVKYLGKYVSKSAESIASKELPNTRRLSAADRKALLSCMLPVLAGIRQYRFSIRDNGTESGAADSSVSGDIAELENLVRLGSTTPSGDSSLIRLLNKLTDSCQCRAWVAIGGGTGNYLSRYIGWYESPPPELLADFQEMGHPLGCCGCVISQFLFNLQHGNEDQLPLPGEKIASVKYFIQKNPLKSIKTRKKKKGVFDSENGKYVFARTAQGAALSKTRREE